MKNIIRVYDQNMTKLAYLDKAYSIGYELPLNEVYYATFTLPADDTKNIYCQPFNFVEIYDDNKRIELFRIMPSKLTRNSSGDIIYECEHVIATLMDDILFKYHQIGNIGIGTTTSLRYILDRQTTNRWQLKDCDFDRRFEYKWENENLLAALFSIPQVFNEDYRWEYNTTGSVWRINLKRLSKEFKADVTYKKNMTNIIKEVDPTTVVTRLYCLGYGEGDNQLGIESVNNGVPYLDAATISSWGLKSSVLVDRRFESPDSLKAYGLSLLENLKNPYISYEVQAVDLNRKNHLKYEQFFPGDIVRIIDKEDSIITDLPIVKVSKKDITGEPGAVELEIANNSRDIAGSLSELADRTRINEVYAQGATNQIIIPYADNADNANPSIIRLFIPDTMVRINKCIINYQLEPFRAYSKAIGGGGEITKSTNSGGANYTSTGSGGGSYDSTNSGGGMHDSTDAGGKTTTTSNVDEYINYRGGHNHGISKGVDLMTVGGGSVTWEPSGDHEHGVNIPNHNHSFDVPAHRHSFSIDDHEHSVNIPNHAHSVNIPDHTHKLEFGIYRGTTAKGITIKVDGKTIPYAEIGKDVDIISYLSTDQSGKINRNTWHTIELVPDTLTRVVANVFMQIFTNSRGGGDY